MNFSQLRCFVALAEAGSFTEAAYGIDLTQSAVSHALSTLERELGVSLLERNNKGVVALTSIGQKLLPHARALLAQVETIQQEARAAQGLFKGKLRLGSAHPIASPLLAGVLAHFQQLYPDIKVVLFEGSFQEVLHWMNTSVIDVGVVLHRTKGVESTLLVTDEMQVFVAQGHRLYARTSVTLNDLHHEQLIARPTGCNIFEGIAPPLAARVCYQAIECTTILAMVREGLGITILPRRMLPDELEGVKAIPLEPPHLVPIGLAVTSTESASLAATLFVQSAVAWVQEQEELAPRAR